MLHIFCYTFPPKIRLRVSGFACTGMYNDNRLPSASVSDQCLPVAPAMSDHKEHLILRLLNSTGHYSPAKFWTIRLNAELPGNFNSGLPVC